MSYLSMVTVINEFVLLRTGDELVGCNCLAKTSHIADSLPTQLISMYRILSIFVCNNADAIDVKVEICCLTAFNPTTYKL